MEFISLFDLNVFTAVFSVQITFIYLFLQNTHSKSVVTVFSRPGWSLILICPEQPVTPAVPA